VIKDNVFIGLVKLNEQRECRSSRRRASTKIGPFPFPIPVSSGSTPKNQATIEKAVQPYAKSDGFAIPKAAYIVTAGKK
jgi:hypothetical protein